MPVQYQLINCMPYSLSDNAFYSFKSSSVTIRKLLFGATPPSSSNLPFSILSSVLLSYSVNFDFSSSKNAFGLFLIY